MRARRRPAAYRPPQVRRIYAVNPLLCPRCSGPLALVAVITEQEAVTALLRHLEKSSQPTSVHARSPPAA